MIYLNRLWKLIELICKAIIKLLGFIALIAMISVYCVTSVFVLLPISIALQLVWFIFVHPIYYIATGKKYGDTYNGPVEMWGDMMFGNNVTLKIEKSSSGYHKGFFERYKDKLDDIKLEL